jgi:hypothetical protein
MPQVPTPPAPPTPPPDVQAPVIVQTIPSPPPWVTMPPQVTLLIVLGFFAACAVVLYPLMRALGRRIEGRHADTALRGEVDQMRHRLEEMDGLSGRLMELEERVDFAERMLTQRGEPARLPRETS